MGGATPFRYSAAVRFRPPLARFAFLAAAVGFASCGRPEALVVLAGPEAVESFEVREAGGQVLWRIEAEPAVVVERIVYGTVPAGFEQRVPADGSPRPFVSGEPLETETVTALRTFLHTGHAEGPSTWEITDSRMLLRAFPRPGAAT